MMNSTFLNYRFYAADMTRSIARIEQDAMARREAQYYAENIGKVETVDDLLSDYRLKSYVLKAYGLGEHIGSDAFVRQILESDLSDQSSFVNRLSDKRYRDFAGAFDFASASAPKSVQSQAQTDRLVEAYSDHIVRGANIAAQNAGAFEAKIGSVTNVDQLLNDPATFAMIAKIAGLDPAITSKSYMRLILIEDIPASTPLSSGLAFLSEAFSFDENGVAEPGGAQTKAQTVEFVGRYLSATGHGRSAHAAGFEARYFEAQAASVTNVGQLVDDPTLYNVIVTAFGLDPLADSPSVLKGILSGDPSAPDHPLNHLPTGTEAQKARKERLLALREAFAFDAGGASSPQGALKPGALDAILSDFHAAYPVSSSGSEIALRTNSFRVQLSNMKSINDLLNRHPVYGNQAFEFILKAFDIDPSIESKSKIRRVLQSDPSDPNSYVRKLNDARYENLAAAFNFGSDGSVRSERLVQSVRVQQTTASLYAASFGTDQSERVKDEVRTATEAYLTKVNAVRSLDDLLASPSVLDYSLKAHGLEDRGFSTAELRKILTSDLSDPASFANSFNDPRIRDFAGSFNFQPDGRISPGGDTVQRPAELLTTQNLYLLQLMEEKAGETSEGARLSLYFLRKAPDIKNAFSILADRALFETVRTALGLPASMSQLDIDQQARILEQRLDFSDFQDPQKLDSFISRFAALYDIENGTAANANPVLQLFGGGGSGGIAGLF